jgi:GntP family gluconate:H+ symporter
LFGRVAANWVPIGAAGAGLQVAGGSPEGEVATTSTGAAPGTGGGGPTLDVATQPRVAGSDPDSGPTRIPSFTATLVTVLSPVVLMLLKAASDVWMSKDAALYPVLQFIGDPMVALLLAVLLAMYTFGTAIGFGVPELSRKIGTSLMPIAGVMLIVGAGGGFKQVLVDSGAGTAIAKIAIAANLSALLLGWIVAVLIRLATGSATVATVTAAGIVAPLAVGESTTQIALVVLAIGAGSLFFSHVNDAGFWLVKEYFGLSVGQTIKSWSLMETAISVSGLVFVLVLNLAI